MSSDLGAMNELEIAKSVNSVFAAVDKWKKIDPPIPVTVMGVDMMDVVVPDELDFGAGKAVISVRNDYENAAYIAPRVIICDGHGIIDSATLHRKLLQPREVTAFTADLTAPRAILRDPAGFNLYVCFELSEPEGMSIAGLHGPYIKHFAAGNKASINKIRNTNEYCAARRKKTSVRNKARKTR